MERVQRWALPCSFGWSRVRSARRPRPVGTTATSSPGGRTSTTPHDGWGSCRSAERRWLDGAFTKVCVRADSEEELLAVVEKAREAGVLVQLCVDAGRTEFHGVPTPTCSAVGPDYPERIDPITGHLKLL